MSQQHGLKILIVGGGIGGLTAAIALRQQGHKVEVFEKSKFAIEVGAAINITSNSTVILERLGLSPPDFDAVLCTGLWFVDEQGNSKHHQVFDEAATAKWPAAYYLSQRSTFHAALKYKATAPDGPGPAVILHTNSAVTSLNCSTPSITLVDGTIINGDLVIGADGVHSATRDTITGRVNPLFDSGKCFYRWLLPTAAVETHPELSILIEQPGLFVGIEGAERRIFSYPCAGGKILNCAAMVPSEEVGPVDGGSSGYDQQANKQKLISQFSTFGPTAQKLLQLVPEHDLKIWNLLDMNPLPTWINDRAALLGDAAHPFLPYMGQGASQAVEDGAVLGLVLHAGVTTAEIPARLQFWESLRKGRAHRIQDVTRRRGREPGDPRGSLDHVEFAKCLAEATEFDAWAHAAKAVAEWEKDRAV